MSFGLTMEYFRFIYSIFIKCAIFSTLVLAGCTDDDDDDDATFRGTWRGDINSTSNDCGGSDDFGDVMQVAENGDEITLLLPLPNSTEPAVFLGQTTGSQSFVVEREDSFTCQDGSSRKIIRRIEFFNVEDEQAFIESTFGSRKCDEAQTECTILWEGTAFRDSD